jgi:transcriptional regulator with GAF, ATPase, and Fis domain
MPVLTITGPDGTERRVEWVDGSIGIGRDPSNHVELEDARVGRWHAAIFEEAGPSYRLRDLGSARGTLVAGKRIQSHPLRAGDEIGVGPFRLAYSGDTGCAKATPGGHALHIRFGIAVKDPIGLQAKERTLSGQIGWESAADGADGTRPSPRALFEAIQSVAARLDLDELLECLLEQVDRLAAPSVSFAALVRDDGSLDVRQRRSRIEPEPGPKGVRVSQTVIQRTLESGKPILAFKRETSVSMSELGISRAVGLPLVAHGRVRGLIYGDWRQWGEPPQDEERMEWVAALVLHAGTAFENALHYQRLQSQKQRLEQSHRALTQIVGMSHETRTLLDDLDRCARRDFDVLIKGPTGTGKELVARRLHEQSARRDGPFIAVNCASIPRELFESEMFGHKRGSFSGATSDRLGRFQEAHGGTLFLDELGELATDHQARLLRVLDEHKATPVGGPPVPVDLRVIAATNRDLEQAVEEGTFRSDLLYRLGIPLRTTPLKDRPEDIPILAYYLLDRLAQGEDLRDISAEAMEYLMQHRFPGNVRELRRLLRNALVHSGTRIELPDLDRDGDSARGARGLPTLEQLEADHIRKVLRATGAHQGRAARILGVSPNTLKAKMDRYKISRDDFRR